MEENIAQKFHDAYINAHQKSLDIESTSKRTKNYTKEKWAETIEIYCRGN